MGNSSEDNWLHLRTFRLESEAASEEEERPAVQEAQFNVSLLAVPGAILETRFTPT